MFLFKLLLSFVFDNTFSTEILLFTSSQHEDRGNQNEKFNKKENVQNTI